MGNIRKGKASHGPRTRKAAAQRNASAYEETTGGDTVQRTAGRVAHEDAVRRGLEASEACRNRALRERDISRAQAADAELKSRDATNFAFEMDASVSSEKELKLAAEAFRMKAKEERLQQAELALRAERQHRAWKERWPCHADGAVYIVSLYT